jgi:predicted nucleic acid-binding Zn ribbon protein
VTRERALDSSAKRSRPVPLRAALDSLLEQTELGARIAEALAVPEWAERVGPAIAAVTVPLRVSRGTLYVGVRSSAWLMELTALEGSILQRLNGSRARGKISRIRFQMWAG